MTIRSYCILAAALAAIWMFTGTAEAQLFGPRVVVMNGGTVQSAPVLASPVVASPVVRTRVIAPRVVVPAPIVKQAQSPPAFTVSQTAADPRLVRGVFRDRLVIPRRPVMTVEMQ